MNRRAFVQTSLLGLTAFSGLTNAQWLREGPSDVPVPVPEGSETSETRAKTATRYNGTVALWYTAHFQVDPRDWNNIKEFGGRYHPLLGYYKSDDRAVIAKHLHWIRRAGVDVIVYDVYGSHVWGPKDLPKDKALPLIMKALAHQVGERRKLKLCIWLEKYTTNPTYDEYEFAVDYIRKNLAENDYYFRYQGKPLVVTYLNGTPTPAIDYLDWKNTYLHLHRVRPYVSDAWSYIEYYPQMLRKGWMSACPGFDSFLEDAYLAKLRGETSPADLAAIRRKAQRAEREGGAFYQKQLRWAKEHNPDIIFLSAWNDWQYGNQIEPAVEYQFQYVDLTAKVLGRWKETEAYRKGPVPAI